MEAIDRVFDNLDKWRHFPCYQLERRADIFFSLYLPEVLERRFKVPMHPVVVPELPAYKPLLIGQMDDEQRKLVLGKKANDPTSDTYRRSYRIDYLALSQDMSKAYLVELKTDQNSWKKKQQICMDAAVRAGIGPLLDALSLIVPAASKKDRLKYRHLLTELRSLGLVDFPDTLCDSLLAADNKSVAEEFRHYTSSSQSRETTIVYVAPKPTDAQKNAGPCIDFEYFAAAIGGHDDSVARRFASSLKDWSSPSGSDTG